jgi:anaerobic ribonucleoside-triphosphate reductase
MSEEIKLEDSERQPCEVFSRVMGYFRPVYDWNIGKKQEFRDRKMYNVEPIQER